ncbi:tetratricopeptide repeat protein [Enhygromyxa salina]|uniref:Tetratricopeptide repeat protein n=1 Tax=Enhygromyxa salina TaxID=215803 RepID=A0A2S9YF13_9BACT|nr:tetratricopeptide repeat protein [Enhygromyxa salina]PRQ03708.1 tetratricopeptide repeat protein [Enhygromyxa salina]
MNHVDERARRWGRGVGSALALWVLTVMAVTAVDAAPPRDTLPPPETTGGELPGVDDSESGDPEVEVDPLTLEQQREVEFADHLGRAKRAMQQRRWSEAIDEYSAALDIHDGDPEALRGRAHVHKRANPPGRCPRLAIEDLTLLEVYDPRGLWLSERENAVAWMGECENVYAKERLDIAEELAGLDVGALGRPDDIRVTAAQLHAAEAEVARVEQQQHRHLAAAVAHLDAYRQECRAREAVPKLAALELEGALHRRLEQPQEAVAVYERILVLHPDELEAARDAKKWIDELQIQLAVAEIQELQGGRPTPAAEAAYDRGLRALRRRDLATARSELEIAVGDSPWYPRAHYYLGEVYARSEDFPAAIESFKRAIAMERYDYATHMALGLLYKKEFSGAEDEQARTHLDMALRLRPDLHVLRFHLGELYARSDKEQAIEHFRDYLEFADADEPKREAAREAIAALQREVEEDVPFVPPPLPSDVGRLDPELHRLISEAYVLGAEHGEWDRAETLLLRAREKFPRETALLNMLAQVVYVQDGRQGQARVYWDESLAVDPNQMEVHERLGLMLADSKEGRSHLRTAAELGSVIARYRVAKLLWDNLELWAASEQLDIYLREAGPYDVYWDAAQELRGHMDAVFLKIYLAMGVGSLILLSIPLALIWRRVRGASLPQLLERSPTCFPEVARILSLIRHEILKHNTAFLSDVGRALELDEPDAEARATLLARRLFGDDVEPEHDPHRGERRGIHGRFLGYVAELEQVARAHGVTLNLRRKDPTFKAMLRAFDDVAAKAKWLRHPGGLRASKKLELAKVLLRAGDVLGRRAFDRLSEVIQRLCIARVDPEFIASVYEQVATEDKFATVQIAPLSIEGQGEQVRIFRTDLHDILANVLRNSLMSSAMYAQPPIGLGVELATEIDDITGLSTLAIRIKDHSPERLTSEMLRGRYVERGMGITADLLSRYDGSIAVEPEAGWEKAVVLRFFALDEDEDEDAATDAPARADEVGVGPATASPLGA